MAMMVYRTCQQVEGGLPAAVQSQMMFNIVLGDMADGKLLQAFVSFRR
jgi:hypothetical protein